MITNFDRKRRGQQILQARPVNTPDTSELAFDYHNQAWIIDGKYQRCGHPEEMNCRCYGRLHEGEPANMTGDVH